MSAKCQRLFLVLPVVLWIVRLNVVDRVGQLVAARLVALGLLAPREPLERPEHQVLLARQVLLVRQGLLELRV